MTTLRWLGWEGYADGALASALHEATGLSVRGENHLSDDLACRKVLDDPGAWDVININTPFVRDALHPRGAIRVLPERFTDEVNHLAGPFRRFKSAATGPAGETLGVPQRCGPFNLVINQDKLSPAVAREQGFRLALDPAFHRRFGILYYEDFNIMHVAIAAGLDPFQSFDAAAFSSFAETARTIYGSAPTISVDHNLLNRALVDGEIDFYISGGVYTASPARLAGRLEVRAITPDKGPIGGKGGVAFVEVNALVNQPHLQLEAGEAFLDFIASDEGAVAASLAADACNPIAQMHRASAFSSFTREQLAAMQWDDFEEDMSRCADYEIIPDYPELAKIVRRLTSARNDERSMLRA